MKKVQKCSKSDWKTAKFPCFYPPIGRFRAEMQQKNTKIQQKTEKTRKTLIEVDNLVYHLGLICF
jgi:hypothetical protein